MTNFNIHEKNLRRYAERIKAEERAEEEKRRKGEVNIEEEKTDTSPISAKIGEVSFLGGETGRQVHEKILKDWKDVPAVYSDIDFADDIVKGSKPFYVVAVNQILKEQGIRTATQADLEKILRDKKLELKGTYEDSGLVWRSDNEPNEYLARNISAQLRKRNINLNEPIVLLLYGLEIVKDGSSPHGVSFKLREDCEIIHAPILNVETQQKFNSSDIEHKTGLPKRVGEKGNRYLWTRKNGLSRLFLVRNLGIVSDSEVFANSSSNGRVVLIAGEGAEYSPIHRQITDVEASAPRENGGGK